MNTDSRPYNVNSNFFVLVTTTRLQNPVSDNADRFIIYWIFEKFLVLLGMLNIHFHFSGLFVMTAGRIRTQMLANVVLSVGLRLWHCFATNPPASKFS